jgi:hypothetical protein
MGFGEECFVKLHGIADLSITIKNLDITGNSFIKLLFSEMTIRLRLQK